jgi:hypothetical protein
MNIQVGKVYKTSTGIDLAVVDFVKKEQGFNYFICAFVDKIEPIYVFENHPIFKNDFDIFDDCGDIDELLWEKIKNHDEKINKFVGSWQYYNYIQPYQTE